MDEVSSNYLIHLRKMSDKTTYNAGVAQSAMNRLLRKFTDDCLRPHGLTTMQWFITGTIYDAGNDGISVTDLSKRVDTNVPYITNTLNLLEHKGGIERRTSETDSRKKVVRIADGYRPICEAIEADLRKRMREVLYARITPEELKTYLTVISKLNQAL